MKIHFRRINCVVVILTIMVGILFPGEDYVYAGKKTKITVSLTNSEYAMKDYIDEFEKRNPDIEVEYCITNNYDESMGQKIKEGKEIKEEKEESSTNSNATESSNAVAPENKEESKDESGDSIE